MPAGIASSLRRLRGLHLRLSLCRVTLAPGNEARLGAIDDSSLIAELADDGSLVAIYIHPRGIDDNEAACGVAARLEQTLKRSGLPLSAVRITILACDAAAIDVNDASLVALAGQPSRSLLSFGGPPSAAAS